MRTLRLLFWLRWRIGMNTTSSRGRWAAAGITALLALAMSPLYLGGAVGAWAYASHTGSGALLVVFGLCQLLILWVSLLTGAMGRLFELDKLKRYPLRSFDVFSINTLASLSEPIVLMTVPSLVAAAFGVARHDGAAAGFAAMGGGIVLLLVTASLLQLVLALLDDLLRREWMRYVAAFLFTITIIAFQVAVGRSSERLEARAREAGFTPERLASEVMHAFERIPTVAGPASLAGAQPAGFYAEPLAGSLVCLVLLAGPLMLGARVMAQASRRAGVGASVRTRSSAPVGGGFARRLPGFTIVQSLLIGREFRYLFRTPALLYQMAVIPLTAIGISLLPRSGDPEFGWFAPVTILVTTLASRNLMLWGYDGPGVRTLFLMPLAPRDLVLSKNIVWLASALAEAGLVLVFLTAMRPGVMLPQLPMIVAGYVSVALAGGVLGTWVSIARPMKPSHQGLSRRSPGGVVGLLAVLAIVITGGAVVLAVLAARALAPAAWEAPASFAATALALLVSAVVWWIALERNADLLERRRETMIDVLAKSADV